MKRDRFLVIGILTLAILAFVAAKVWYQGSEAKRVEKLIVGREPLVRFHSPRLGPDAAPVTVVEFLDPECESCSAFYPTVKKVLREFEGKVQLVVRYMPLHNNSAYVASVLEATRPEGRYWEALEMLFARQPEWASHHAPRPELIMVYMKELGLSVDHLENVSQEPEIKRRILQDQEDGLQLGVMRTPAFFINGKLLPRLDYRSLREAIERELQHQTKE